MDLGKGIKMPYVVVQHRVKKDNWGDFETVFRNDAHRRRELGSKGAQVLRDLNDPERVFVLFEWESDEGALKFVGGKETQVAFVWASSSAGSKANATEVVFCTEA